MQFRWSRMADPCHILARQDYIWFKADKDKNLKAIQAFQLNDNELALCFEDSFNDQGLLEVFEALSHSFDRWKLTNVM